MSAFAQTRTASRTLDSPRGLVIGSGIAWLTAARRLAGQDHVVTVIDTRRLVLASEAIGRSHVGGVFLSGLVPASAVVGPDR